MNRLDALALAIAREYSALDPGSEAFVTLNPGMLRGHSLDRLHIVNENGVRVFKSFHAGYRALIGNLEAKCQGKTRANGLMGKITPNSSVSDLVKTFRYVQSRKIVEFLQDALDDKALSEMTPVSFFMDGQNG